MMSLRDRVEALLLEYGESDRELQFTLESAMACLDSARKNGKSTMEIDMGESVSVRLADS